VTEIETHDEQALQSELATSRKRLDGFEAELRSITGELDDLAEERQQYDLLHEICGSLEKLQELGGEELFWNGSKVAGGGAAHVSSVRVRVDDFGRRVSEIEVRRQSVVAKIHGEGENSEILEDDLSELRWREEQKKLEWLVERDDDAPGHLSIMPWSREGEDDRRFRRSLAAALLLSLLLGLILPMINIPIPDRWEAVEVPERLTRLIKKEIAPPPPPVQLEKRPEEKLAATDEPMVAEKQPEPSKAQAPKKTTETKGILAFREEFSGLAESRPTARLGAQARINRAGEKSSSRSQRALVTTQAPGSSRGINLAALSRELGGGGSSLDGVEVGQATSSIGAINGPERPLSGGPGPARTDEEIQIVFDRHKSALYRLYNRELRRDPTLEGQMVLRMTIEPDGSVSLCDVQSSDMNAPNLSSQVVKRVNTFDFGAKEGVPAITILYPIDFLPAT